MMKIIVKNLTVVLVITMACANIFVMVNGVRLSAEVQHYEQETNRLRNENLNLERMRSEAESLQRAASLAAELHFRPNGTLIYLDTQIARAPAALP